MKNYAYLSEKEILHVVKDRETAEMYATGRIVETELAARGGYPLADGEEIIVYSETDMRLAAKGAKLPEGKYPALAALYQACRK